MVAIITTAMFLQAGRHPAPMFGVVALPAAAVSAPLPRVRPAEAEPRPAEVKPPEPVPASAKSASAQRPTAVAASRSDPVGDLINATRRIAAVQRALTEFGYGQLKPTGVIGADTQAAIQKFERDRKLPVTGRFPRSERYSSRPARAFSAEIMASRTITPRSPSISVMFDASKPRT